MKKRTFIKTGAILSAGTLLSPILACKQDTSQTNAATKETVEAKPTGPFSLPALAFGLDALVPNIDAKTMEIHHGKHHAGYVRKLNAALDKSQIKDTSLVQIVSSISDSDEDVAIRNNGGGHYNHSLFWEVMKPGGGSMPSGVLKEAITSTFGSLEKFQERFSKAAKTRFGSGWAWLSVDKSGKLFVSSTPNQDNPLMTQVVDQPGTPILGIDVWEHAYYLNYQNRRGDYVKNFFNVINWEAVAERLSKVG